VAFHCFADDVQVYLPLNLNDLTAIKTLQNCLEEVVLWLDSNFLSLNKNKTEIVVFGKPNCLQGWDSAIGPLDTFSRSSTKNLGVILDCSFKFDKQVSAVVKSSFYHLRLLSKIKPYLPKKDLERAVHAFVTSRLDYCNSLYCGLEQRSLRRLQGVQNAAARFLTGKRKRDQITPVLASLHWLPVSFRVQFKILLIVFKCLTNTAPPYLSDMLYSYTPARALRSADQLLLTVPKTRLITRGDRAFSVVGPRLWNGLYARRYFR